jgi:hypothetical protein
MFNLHHLKKGIMMVIVTAAKAKNVLTLLCSLKSLGEVSTSPTHLHKAGSSKQPPLQEVDNLFNEQVIEQGCSCY